MKHSFHHAIRIAALTTMLSAPFALAAPFTYQGQLRDGGASASGTYDFQLQLFDTLAGDTQIGPTLTFDDVTVTDGTFQINPDFGDIFDNSNPFIDIQVRDGASTGPYTRLTPRTQINATPKAQHATIADTVLNTQWDQTPTQLNYGTGSQKVFINRSSPITPTEYFGVHSTTPGFVGMFVSGPTGALPFYGYSVNGAASAYTYVQPSDGSWRLVNNGVIAFRSDASQNFIVTNNAHADGFIFNTPKTGYISVMGDSFHAASSDNFIGSTGSAGAYITDPGTGWLVAPIQLPHGATVTDFRTYITDNSAGSAMNITLSRRTHGFGGFSTLASTNTTGWSGTLLQLTDSTINSPFIDNNLYSYQIRVWALNWDGSDSMQIESVVVEYSTPQAD